jgi:uncharacterized protein (UPF0276 family)
MRWPLHQTAVGVSYSEHTAAFVEVNRELVDFLEVPFELLLKAPDRIEEVLSSAPVLIHCASLSLAGNVPPSGALVDRLGELIARTKTPWVGEHLAFVCCEARYSGGSAHEALVAVTNDEEDDGVRYDVGFTVSPQMTSEVADRVTTAVDKYETRFGLPILLENSPLYFSMPGSNLSQVEFIGKICKNRPRQRLLLDLVHLEITCHNENLCLLDTLCDLPLDRVDEVHLSGHSEGDVWWDDHSSPIREETFDLLDALLKRCCPKAVTLEYNWGTQVPAEVILRDLERVKRMLGAEPNGWNPNW